MNKNKINFLLLFLLIIIIISLVNCFTYSTSAEILIPIELEGCNTEYIEITTTRLIYDVIDQSDIDYDKAKVITYNEIILIYLIDIKGKNRNRLYEKIDEIIKKSVNRSDFPENLNISEYFKIKFINKEDIPHFKEEYKNEIQVYVNRDKITKYGLTVNYIAEYLRSISFSDKSVKELEQIIIEKDGKKIPLNLIADFKEVSVPVFIIKEYEKKAVVR